jgi:hypothetical protein
MNSDIIKNWENIPGKSGESFNELIKLDQIPLWWFLKRMFVYNVVPSHLGSLDNIKEDNFLNNNLYQPTLNVIAKKYLFYNEMKKIKKSKVKLKKEDGESSSTVLFVSYTNHIKKNEEGKERSIFRLDNLLRELNKNESISNKLAIFSPLTEKANKISSFSDLIYNSIDKELVIVAKKKARRLYKESKLFTKNNYNNKELKLIKNHLDFLLSYEMILLVVLYYETLKKKVNEENIKAVVLTADSLFFERCALAAAHNSGINSFIIQHGTGTGFAELEGQFLVKNKFLVFGEYFKEQLLAKDYKENQIEVVGPLVFDEIVKYKEIPMATERKILLLTATFWEDKIMVKNVYLDKLKEIITTLSKDNIKIIIKPHPREKNEDNYLRLIKENHFDNVILNKKTDQDELYKQIRESCLVVTLTDGAIMESIILEREVIFHELINSAYSADIKNNLKDLRITRTPAELRDAFRESIREENANGNKKPLENIEFTNPIIYKSDGLSYQRTAEIIISLI